ncbi:hypothetical protein M0802_012719 [Mischocyttarus mexicanus]|nr:hypothetical protein M0802_012719 [Mischocyttarus mexicanus]
MACLLFAATELAWAALSDTVPLPEAVGQPGPESPGRDFPELVPAWGSFLLLRRIAYYFNCGSVCHWYIRSTWLPMSASHVATGGRAGRGVRLVRRLLL